MCAEWVNSHHRCAGILPTASVWLRVSHPLWAFALLPISPPTIVALLVSRSTFPYFLFLPLFLQFPVIPLPKSCWACLLQVPSPAYFPTSLYPFLLCTSFPSCIFFFPYFLHSPTSHVCPALPLPKSYWAWRAAPGLSSSVLHFLSLYPSSCTSLYSGFYFFFCVFLSLFLLGFSWKMYYYLLMLWFFMWIWCISSVCLHFCHNLAWSLICH